MGMCLKPSVSPVASISRRFIAQNWSNLSLTRPSQSWLWSFFCIFDTTWPRCFSTSASFKHDMKCASTISLFRRKINVINRCEDTWCGFLTYLDIETELLPEICRSEWSAPTAGCRHRAMWDREGRLRTIGCGLSDFVERFQFTYRVVPFQRDSVAIEPNFALLCIIRNVFGKVLLDLGERTDAVTSDCSELRRMRRTLSVTRGR